MVDMNGSNTGSVVSSMVKVAETLLALPQSSVAVNVTVEEPVAPVVAGVTPGLRLFLCRRNSPVRGLRINGEPQLNLESRF